MDAPRHSSGGHAVSAETLITIKVSVNDMTKRLKLPLRDLGATTLPVKLRQALNVKPDQGMQLERYSDSSAGYITLDAGNPQVFKTLIRAAKAKLKLRLKATITSPEAPKVEEKVTLQQPHLLDDIMQPVATPMRESTAFDQRSIGSGIFKFRDARAASQQTLVNNEAPVPSPFGVDSAPATTPTVLRSGRELAYRPVHVLTKTVIPKTVPTPADRPAWSVYCNECDKPMDNEHFHCSICDGGDFDLCEQCVMQGKVCPGDGHWLIKRFIRDGTVINSTTERILPSKAKAVNVSVKPEPEGQKEIPGAFNDDTKTLSSEPRAPTRTCNSCVVVLPEREFVTCTTCADFDLCIECHTQDAHNHHPAHGFKAATENTILPLAAQNKLAAGRNVRHNAICDGCDKMIFGVRHKCLNCPDWDYCGDCVKSAATNHPHHRFAPLFEPIADVVTYPTRHHGIFCDGPLCVNKSPSYISGVRYKCTICHDADFCAACEALPTNEHNRTHPLIKLKTPVRNMNISTESEDVRGNVRQLGDRQASVATKSVATETNPVQQTNAATQVQTVAEITPTEVKSVVDVKSIDLKNGEAVSIPVKKFLQKANPLLNAHFIHDSVPDGQVSEPETRFTQIWTMKNPGPFVWPAGCSVRYVGGDNMLNVDNMHPASVTAISEATESNVIGREVAVGEEIAFKITLKAPKREGRSISYWRLKAADGTPFGHRLWCDIEVKKPESDTPSGAESMAVLRQKAAMLKENLKQGTEQLKQDTERLARAFAATSVPGPTAYTHFPNPWVGPTQNSADLVQAQVPTIVETPPLMKPNVTTQNIRRLADRPASRECNIAQLNTGAAFETGMNTLSEDERRELLKQRVATIKANIIKARQERAMAMESARKVKAAEAQIAMNEAAKRQAAAIQAASLSLREQITQMQAAAAQTATQSVEAPVKIEQQTSPISAGDEQEDEKLETSQMVFPKLDKESPASSTYQSMISHSSKGKAAYVESEAGEVEHSAAPTVAEPAPSVASALIDEEDDFESVDGEIEVLSAAGEDESDDGFLTDEEYDILDASDSETIA